MDYECEVCGTEIEDGEDWDCNDCNAKMCWGCYKHHEMECEDKEENE